MKPCGHSFAVSTLLSVECCKVSSYPGPDTEAKIQVLVLYLGGEPGNNRGVEGRQGSTV